MGQAKQRGTYEERVAQAVSKKKDRTLPPIYTEEPPTLKKDHALTAAILIAALGGPLIMRKP